MDDTWPTFCLRMLSSVADVSSNVSQEVCSATVNNRLVIVLATVTAVIVTVVVAPSVRLIVTEPRWIDRIGEGAPEAAIAAAAAAWTWAAVNGGLGSISLLTKLTISSYAATR